MIPAIKNRSKVVIGINLDSSLSQCLNQAETAIQHSNVTDSFCTWTNRDFVINDFLSITSDRITQAINTANQSEFYFDDYLFEGYYGDIAGSITLSASDATVAFAKADEYISAASCFSLAISTLPEVKELMESLSINSQTHIILENQQFFSTADDLIAVFAIHLEKI